MVIIGNLIIARGKKQMNQLFSWFCFCFLIVSLFFLVKMSDGCMSEHTELQFSHLFCACVCFCVWQLKRDNGLPVFDLDATMATLAQKYREEQPQYAVC